MKKAVKAARVAVVVAMEVHRASLLVGLVGTWVQGKLPLSTPKYRFLARQHISSHKLVIMIALNTRGNFYKI